MSRILTDWIDSYLEYTEDTEPAENYRIWVAISTIAAVMKRKCTLELGNLRIHPNMYIILVGPPAARKGTAMKDGIDFLYKTEIAMSADSLTKEALIESIAENYTNDIREDGTMNHNCSYTICSPEFSVLIGHGDMQMLRYLTDWFDCGKGPDGIWTYRTKGRGVETISGIWVNLIGATTPDQIGNTPEIIGTGLASRIIFVFEERKGKVIPFPCTDNVKQADLLKDLEQIQLMNGSFTVTKEWLDAYAPWYIDNDTNPPFKDRRLAKYCDRRPLHVLKLCMILSASRGDDMKVTEVDLARAIKIIKKTEINMPCAFGSLGDDPRQKTFNNIMREIMVAGEISFADLRSLSYFDMTDPMLFEGVLTTLESMGSIKQLRKQTKTGMERRIIYTGEHKL